MAEKAKTYTPQELFAQADEKFGAFDPSALVPPAEFAPPKPRPIPQNLAQGSHERTVKGGIIGTVIIGLAFCLFSCTGLSRTMGYFIIGMAYSGWIGLGLMLIAGLYTVYHYATIGRFGYVRDGDLIGARLLRNEVWAGGYKNLYFGYTMMVEFLHPDTGERTLMHINTGNQGTRQEYSQFDLRLKPGDYVYLVRLPGKKLEKTLRIYGLLGLNHEQDLLWRNGKPRVGTSALQVVAGCAFAMIFCFGALGVYYGFSYYAPIVPNGAFYGSSFLCAFVFAVLGAIVVFKLLLLYGKLDPQRLTGFVLLSFIASGTIGMLVPAVINAGLDRSPPNYQAIEIHNYWERSWLMFRSFDLEFSVGRGAEKSWYPSTPEHMANFPDSNLAAQEVHSGFLGWPWIRQIHPVMMTKATPPAGRIVATLDGEPENSAFRPVVVNYRDQGFFPLSAEDEQWAWRKLVDKGMVTFPKSEPPGT